MFDHDGGFLGAVTLSGESREVHRHTLGMVIAAAEAIHNRLREKQVGERMSRTDSIARTLVGRMTDAILTIDTEGEIVYANKGAAGLPGCTESKLGGQKINALLPGTRFDAPICAETLSHPFDVVCEIGGRRIQFVVKPLIVREGENEPVQGAILSLSRREMLRTIRSQSKLAAHHTLEDITGDDATLRQTLALARRVAARDSRVLITGETGTGKELLAQGIHNASPRAGSPFVALNCAAVPRELIESELMGYREGAFTGARRGGQVGKFELANRGTLFLDEISQMPLDLQAKLLRVLQDGVVTRLGDTAPLHVDVRVVAATNEDLFLKSQTGSFRPDLFFRLSVMELNLPPLRARGADVLLLAGRMLERACARLDRPLLSFSPVVLDAFCRYGWPGNIRELENVVEMAALMCDGDTIVPANLPARVWQGCSLPPVAAAPVVEPAGDAPGPDDTGGTLSRLQSEAIRRALREYNCNISRVSRALGISRCTVYRKMREEGISRTVSVT